MSRENMKRTIVSMNTAAYDGTCRRRARTKRIIQPAEATSNDTGKTRSTLLGLGISVLVGLVLRFPCLGIIIPAWCSSNRISQSFQSGENGIPLQCQATAAEQARIRRLYTHWDSRLIHIVLVDTGQFARPLHIQSPSFNQVHRFFGKQPHAVPPICPAHCLEILAFRDRHVDTILRRDARALFIDLNLGWRCRSIRRIDTDYLGLGVVDARVAERIVHGPTRGGEDIGLELGRVGLEILFAAAGEAGRGCVGQAEEHRLVKVGEHRSFGQVQIEVVQQTKVLSLIGQVGLDLRCLC